MGRRGLRRLGLALGAAALVGAGCATEQNATNPSATARPPGEGASNASAGSPSSSDSATGGSGATPGVPGSGATGSTPGGNPTGPNPGGGINSGLSTPDASGTPGSRSTVDPRVIGDPNKPGAQGTDGSPTQTSGTGASSTGPSSDGSGR